MILPNNAVDVLEIEHGGTGNESGYIRTGAKAESTIGAYSTIEGSDNISSGSYSHSEGYRTESKSMGSHSEGYSYNIGGIIASSDGSHAEGFNYTSKKIQASGVGAHAEGHVTVAHSKGITASGNGSHAEGQMTTASGTASHAENNNNTASGNYSHAEGSNNTAGYANQHVGGTYNSNKSTTLFEIGNGTSNNRKNVFEVYDDGYLSFDNGTNKIKFGVDGNGNYGYIKAGADTVYPFSYEPTIVKNQSVTRSSSTRLKFTYTKKPKYFVIYISTIQNGSTSAYNISTVIGALDNGSYTIYANGILKGNSALSYPAMQANISSYITVTDNGSDTITITSTSSSSATTYNGSYYVDYIY